MMSQSSSLSNSIIQFEAIQLFNLKRKTHNGTKHDMKKAEYIYKNCVVLI